MKIKSSAALTFHLVVSHTFAKRSAVK